MSDQLPFTIEQFYKFILKGKLMAGKCIKCGRILLPPRPLCDNCFSQEFEWIEVSGTGKLLTYTIIHVAPPEFQAMIPYTVAIVGLENGLKIPGMISGANPNDLKIGMTLAMEFQACNLSKPWPQWPRYCFKPA